jgi:hypothetical protein
MKYSLIPLHANMDAKDALRLSVHKRKVVKQTPMAIRSPRASEPTLEWTMPSHP